MNASKVQNPRKKVSILKRVLVWREDCARLGLPGRMIDLGVITYAQAQERAYMENALLLVNGRLNVRIGASKDERRHWPGRP